MGAFDKLTELLAGCYKDNPMLICAICIRIRPYS